MLLELGVWEIEADDDMGCEGHSINEMLAIIANFPWYWSGRHYTIYDRVTGKSILTVYLKKRLHD